MALLIILSIQADFFLSHFLTELLGSLLFFPIHYPVLSQAMVIQYFLESLKIVSSFFFQAAVASHLAYFDMYRQSVITILQLLPGSGEHE